MIHQGTYLLPALGIAGCAIGLRAVWPRFACGWLLLNLVLMLVIYVPDFEPVPTSAFQPGNAILAAVGLAAFAAFAFEFRPGRRRWRLGSWREPATARSPMPSPASPSA